MIFDHGRESSSEGEIGERNVQAKEMSMEVYGNGKYREGQFVEGKVHNKDSKWKVKFIGRTVSGRTNSRKVQLMAGKVHGKDT